MWENELASSFETLASLARSLPTAAVPKFERSGSSSGSMTEDTDDMCSSPRRSQAVSVEHIPSEDGWCTPLHSYRRYCLDQRLSPHAIVERTPGLRDEQVRLDGGTINDLWQWCLATTTKATGRKALCACWRVFCSRTCATDSNTAASALKTLLIALEQVTDKRPLDCLRESYPFHWNNSLPF